MFVHWGNNFVIFIQFLIIVTTGIMMIYDYKTDMGKERAGSILALVQIGLLAENPSPAIVTVALVVVSILMRRMGMR